MLLRFRVSNYRSLRDEQELSMVANSLDDPQGIVVRPDGLDLGVLPVAAIYGANAAGKSNVLAALQFMKNAVMNSHRRWQPEGPIPLDPFLLDPEHRGGASLFEIDVLIDGVRHRYGFELDHKRVIREWLSVYPHQREQVWFMRDADSPEPFKFGKYFKGRNRGIEALTRVNSLFLSVAAENNHLGVLPLYSLLSKCLDAIDPGTRAWLGAAGVTVVGNERERASILELMRSADLGITDLRVRKGAPIDDARVRKLVDFGKNLDVELDFERGRRLLSDGIPVLEFQHGDKHGGTFLPLEKESNGTQVFLSLSLLVLTALRRGSILCVDELDASLHSQLAREVVAVFQDPTLNPRHAQLLFNTHDTALLGNLLDGPHLRRDQIWFVEKDGEGATHLYPLTDFKPRNDENLERGYLQGRYGAIPFIEPPESLVQSE